MAAPTKEAIITRWTMEAQRHDEAATKCLEAADRFEFEDHFPSLATKVREIADLHRACANDVRGWLRSDVME